MQEQPEDALATAVNRELERVFGELAARSSGEGPGTLADAPTRCAEPR